MNNQRNLILAIVLTGLLLFGWDTGVRFFYPHANQPVKTAGSASTQTKEAPPAAANKPTREGGLLNPGDVALEAQDLKTALAAPTRVPIAAPGLSGSINLAGAVLDDLTINRHTATVEKNSGPARIYPQTPIRWRHPLSSGSVSCSAGMWPRFKTPTSTNCSRC